jgi:hypothetical protein
MYISTTNHVFRIYYSHITQPNHLEKKKNLLKKKDTLFIRGLLKKALQAYGPTKAEDFLTFEEMLVIVVVICTWSTDQILYIIFKQYDASTNYIDAEK